jgi:hypothetical protein
MKNLFHLLFAIPAFLFTACDENESVVETEKVQFTFSSADAENSGGRLAGQLPPNVRLYLSYENPSGSVQANEFINILAFGDSYITEPVELPVGRYSIINFFIVSSSNEILFATPKRGSALAAVVDRALPFGFTLGKGKVNSIDMQVIDAKKHPPKAFGYAAFNVTVVNPLPITVFIEENEDSVLTNASGFIYESGADVLLQEFSLDAKINYISFEGDVDAQYKLIIQKEGYVPFERLFSYNALLEGLNGEPLNIVMQTVPPPVPFTFNNYPRSGTFTFDFVFEGEGSINIEWGDGTSQVVGFTPENSTQQIAHEILYEEQYHVVITGDLGQITGFSDNDGFITEIDLAGLPNLSSLTLQYGNMLLLDVSKAPLLESLTIRHMDIIDANLENNLYLKNLTLDVIFDLQAEQMITKFHANVVAHNITNGTIVTTGIFPELSNQAHSLIFDLRDNYGFLWINDEHG